MTINNLKMRSFKHLWLEIFGHLEFGFHFIFGFHFGILILNTYYWVAHSHGNKVSGISMNCIQFNGNQL